MTTDGKEKVFEWFNEIFSLSFNIIDNTEKSKEVRPMLLYIEDTAKILKKQLNLVFITLLKVKSKSKSKLSEKSSFLGQAQVEFFSLMRGYFFDTFLPILAQVNIDEDDWRIDLYESVHEEVRKTAMMVFHNFSKKLGNDSITIFASIKAEKRLSSEMYHLFHPEEIIKNKGKKKGG